MPSADGLPQGGTSHFKYKCGCFLLARPSLSPFAEAEAHTLQSPSRRRFVHGARVRDFTLWTASRSEPQADEYAKEDDDGLCCVLVCGRLRSAKMWT